ncbi:MAG TPA: substrate-binding domain-containing protein, partial [Lapillicoccus sp.]
MKPAIALSRRTRVVALASAAGVALALGACSSSSGGSDSGATGGGGEKIGVTLITKDSNNPFFVTMQTGAKAYATKQGNINLTIASGKQEGDDQGQIDAIEASIAKGDKGILITPMSTGVNSAMKKARDAGLYVIALDTPPDPPDTVDITFATDNFKAGKLIGQWAQVQMAGKPATIAMLDLFNDKVVSVDYNRDQGFLTGMGIPVNDPKKNGDEAKTGNYTGGTYTIVCNEAGNGAADGGRAA